MEDRTTEVSKKIKASCIIQQTASQVLPVLQKTFAVHNTNGWRKRKESGKKPSHNTQMNYLWFDLSVCCQSERRCWYCREKQEVRTSLDPFNCRIMICLVGKHWHFLVSFRSRCADSYTFNTCWSNQNRPHRCASVQTHKRHVTTGCWTVLHRFNAILLFTTK